MKFFACLPSRRAQKQTHAASPSKTGGGLKERLLVVSRQADSHMVLPQCVLDTVACVAYDVDADTVSQLCDRVFEAHVANGGRFDGVAVAAGEPDAVTGAWRVAKDLTVDLTAGPRQCIEQLATLNAVLTAALDRQHSDASLSYLSGVGKHAPHLVAALEASFSGLDFRASDDAVVLMPTATQLPDWTMESDDNYDASADYLDRAKAFCLQSTSAAAAAPAGDTRTDTAGLEAACFVEGAEDVFGARDTFDFTDSEPGPTKCSSASYSLARAN